MSTAEHLGQIKENNLAINKFDLISQLFRFYMYAEMSPQENRKIERI